MTVYTPYHSQYLAHRITLQGVDDDAFAKALTTPRVDMSGYGCYAAVKQAIRALTRAAGAEWGSYGIRVNTIAPHALSPGMQARVDARPEEARLQKRTASLRLLAAAR